MSWGMAKFVELDIAGLDNDRLENDGLEIGRLVPATPAQSYNYGAVKFVSTSRRLRLGAVRPRKIL